MLFIIVICFSCNVNEPKTITLDEDLLQEWDLRTLALMDSCCDMRKLIMRGLRNDLLQNRLAIIENFKLVILDDFEEKILVIERQPDADSEYLTMFWLPENNIIYKNYYNSNLRVLRIDTLIEGTYSYKRVKEEFMKERTIDYDCNVYPISPSFYSKFSFDEEQELISITTMGIEWE